MGRIRRFLHRWFVANTLLSGLFALCWVFFRSGPRPSRLAYPCQQAAISTATLAFGAPLVLCAIALRDRLARMPSRLGITAAAIGILATLGAAAYLSHLEASLGTQPHFLQAPSEYRASVFHLEACPQEPNGDRFPCIDGIFDLMGDQGKKIYRSATEGRTSGPQGIIDDDDVVVIKINYQWAERGGSNTDVLQGLIRALVDHPDGFDGEIVVCENAQFASTNGFDRTNNNAQDKTLSPFDVVSHFQDLGFDVSLFDWTPIRETSVSEYSDGNLTDGYVVYAHDSQYNGKVSYPKFQTTPSGTYISLRDGIWDQVSGTYDRDRLKFINLPVLKSHSIYGVTANVKNYMGVVTRELSTNSHNAIRLGLLGDVLGEIWLADLNILDAIWINARPGNGPRTYYDAATRRDELVASTDPVAADLWATVNILVPAFEDNGYSSWPKADPTDPSSNFRQYLDNSATYLLAAGFDVTTDLDKIDAFSRPYAMFSDGFETGDTSGWSTVNF